MHIASRSVTDIRPYDQNPRINESAIDAVAKSLKEFGFRQPIVVDAEGVIVCGHTRWKAATKLGLTVVPVHVATDLSAEQLRAYRIADNQTASLSSWDPELLPVELLGLQEAGFDLALLGFGEEELAGLLDPGQVEGLTDEDAVPEPPDEATTQAGDLWVLGRHRLLCGDSASETDLDRLLDGSSIHLCNTDPPYNVKVEPRSNNAIAAGLSSFQATHHQKLDAALHPEKSKPTGKKLRAKDRPLVNDFVTDEAFEGMLGAWFGNIGRVLEPGRGFYIWGGYAAGAQGERSVLQPVDHLGQAAPRAHPQGFHGGARVVLLRLERGRGARLSRTEQRDRPLAGEEGEPAEHGPPDREAR